MNMKSFLDTFKEARALREQTHPDDVNSGTFEWPGRPGVVFSTESPVAHLKHQQTELAKPYDWHPVKAYWLREEIAIADELMALVPQLTQEFLDYHDDFMLGDFTRCKTYVNPVFDTRVVQSRADAWKTQGIKYSNPRAKQFSRELDQPETRQNFPTAVALTEKYGDDCPISCYSIIESNAVIERHTGIENRDNEFIRIHIPLIIPEGDIFFECEGVEIDWTDLWAFDNQLVHSAHNTSPHRRLIYLIDVRRSTLGLSVGEKYDPRRQLCVPEFVRGALPKMLHQHQR